MAGSGLLMGVDYNPYRESRQPSGDEFPKESRKTSRPWLAPRLSRVFTLLDQDARLREARAAISYSEVGREVILPRSKPKREDFRVTGVSLFG